MNKFKVGLCLAVLLPVLISCGGGSKPDTVDSLTANESDLDIGAALAAPDSPATEPTQSSAATPDSATSIAERVTSPIVREKVNVCEVTSLDSLRECLSNAAAYGGLDIKSDLSCSNGNCCPQNNAIVSLRGLTDFTIHGNSHLIKRESDQRQCALLDISDGNGIVVENWYLDDDVSVPGCLVGESCSRMVHIRNSKNVTLDNVNISNGKGYNAYINGVEKFTFQNSSISNAGILGLYVGHGDNFSSQVTIEDSLFVDVQTNAIALLGVAGSTTNIVRNNMFLRNHWHGHWEVAPRFGTGTTGGGQVYIARANNVLVEGNTILDGYCDNCYVSGGNRTGIHGIELGEPDRTSISNIEIRNNTIGNNDGSGIYLNNGNVIDSSIRISNNVLFNNTDSVQKKLYENGATISANDERSTAYFESFESVDVPGNDFSIASFCASDSSVARVCSGETLHGNCAVTLTVGGDTCDDASVSIESKWYELDGSGVRTAASGWVINGVSSSNADQIGSWCLEFSDADGAVTGIECKPILVNDSIAQNISGLPSIDITPPANSARVRWVARNQGSNPFSLDDIKITGVK